MKLLQDSVLEKGPSVLWRGLNGGGETHSELLNRKN